jgi:hypothetical protein
MDKKVKQNPVALEVFGRVFEIDTRYFGGF